MNIIIIGNQTMINQNPPTNRFMIQKLYLQNKLPQETLTHILTMIPDSLYSEIVLYQILFQQCDSATTIQYIFKDNEYSFCYQFAQFLIQGSINQPLLQFIFHKKNQFYIKESLDIVLKNFELKKLILQKQLVYDGDINNIQQILQFYPRFKELYDYFIGKKQYIYNDQKILIQSLKYSQIDQLIQCLLQCDDKKTILDILISLNFMNDVILNLGILQCPLIIQCQEEQLYFAKWTDSKIYHKKLWSRFSLLAEKQLIKLENKDFVVQNLDFSQPLLIRALFSLVRKHMSSFIIANSSTTQIKKYENYFLGFPWFFKVFFIDKKQLLYSDYSNLILQSLNVILTDLEKSLSQQEYFNFKRFLSIFLLECICTNQEPTNNEANVYYFIQSMLMKDKNLAIQFVIDLKIEQIQNAVNNLECLHIVINDLEKIDVQMNNKQKFNKFCTYLQERHKLQIVQQQEYQPIKVNLGEVFNKISKTYVQIY